MLAKLVERLGRSNQQLKLYSTCINYIVIEKAESYEVVGQGIVIKS